MLGDLPAGDKRRVVIEIDLDAVGGVSADQFLDYRQAVGPNLRPGVGEPVGLVVHRRRVVGLGPHLPLGMPGGEVGHAAVGDLVGRCVQHVEQYVGKKLESPALGVPGDHVQGVHPPLDQRMGVLAGPVPHDVVDQVQVVPPAFPHLGVVEEHAAVAHGVGDGIDAQVQQLVDGLHVLANAHGGLIEVDAGMASVGIEDHFLLAVSLPGGGRGRQGQ